MTLLFWFAKFTYSFMKGSGFMKFKKIEIKWQKITDRKTNKKV